MSEGNTSSPAVSGTTALVPATKEQALQSLFGNTAGGEVCSFDLTTPEGRRLLQSCEELPDGTLKGHVNKRLRIVHVYAKVIELTSEATGEIFPATRICVATTDGQVYSCVSEGVRQSLWRLMRGHGLPPWKGGVEVEVQLRDLASKRQWLTLLEVFDKPAAGRGNR